jgi:cytochrome d ubiquinol oxidase subunit I
MYIAGYIVTGFLVAGAYAVTKVRNPTAEFSRYQRTAFAIPLTIAALASPVQVIVGDWAARDVATNQPVKLAAIEGLYKTTKGASEHLLGIYTDNEVKYGIAIPHLLSLLAFHDPNGTVKGLDTVPPRDRPPVNIVRFAFQTMVGIGTMLALLGVYFVLIRTRKKRLPDNIWFYRAVALAGPLSLIALIAGWITTEVGRQPWVVYDVMRTSQAVTGAPGLPVGYAALAITYAGVAVGVAWILRRLARSPLEPLQPTAT